MTKSILQPDEKICYVSGSQYNLDQHHIYHGSANRKLADKYGCWCWLRHDIHMKLHDCDKKLDKRLQRECQRKFEETHTREEFRKIFGKSYLEEPYMKYEGTIQINAKEKEYIQHTLHTEPKDESECFGEDQIVDYAYKFEDGSLMAIQMCGVQYEENSCNTPWTQAVLFNKDGYEIACSEVSEEYFGEWELEYKDIVYKVTVE